MVDFNKLRNKKSTPKSINPVEIFRRLPKPLGINDLYTSQAEVLNAWYQRRDEKDTVLKLHTGGGKTLVGLLMAQSTLNETSEPVLYLTPTTQLVNQTLEKAKALGINAVPYVAGSPLNDDFINSNAVMVGTYKALFNGRSKFGLRGSPSPQRVGAVILDDAHAAFSVIRDSFTLEVSSSKNKELYESLAELFRQSFQDIGKIGTFDDIVSGQEFAVLEVPYWSWNKQLTAVAELLRSNASEYPLVWPLLRDHLHLCHALVSKDTFTITPILPLVNLFPTFYDAPRRIYMSATISDDSDIIRIFDAAPDAVKAPLVSRSLAGISERMILTPSLMKFDSTIEDIHKLLSWSSSKKFGSVVLTPSDPAAAKWSSIGTVAKGSEQVELTVKSLQEGCTFGPSIFANRYDGIDLPGNACRLLVISGLPTGTSNYELFRASALFGGKSITKMLAQRIEQGIGRGARGAGDYCVVLMIGSDLAGWIAKQTNFQFLTNATKAQLEMGAEVSKEVSDPNDLRETILRSFNRDQGWIEYHAESLAELVDGASSEHADTSQAGAERKAFELWISGYYDKAISKLERCLPLCDNDLPMKGWLSQMAARIADNWENSEKAEDLQKQAYSFNSNLVRPKVLPPYRPKIIFNAQAKSICEVLGGYRQRRGLLQHFNEIVSNLNESATANKFEQSLSELAKFIGFHSERHDDNGEGPDLLWLLPGNLGLVIEAKSRKKAKNALSKDEHGQLLVAEQWFKRNYPDYQCIRVSVHPENIATKAAAADASHALTYKKLSALIDHTRIFLTNLVESQLNSEQLEIECERLLSNSKLNATSFPAAYLEQFKEG